jgi:pimeloyl-ACP methyl ester carboxylesterase
MHSRDKPKRGLPVICVETRHMKAVLKAQINKTDRNDARGIAQMIRAGLYRPVHVKTLRSQKLRMLLTHRELLPAWIEPDYLAHNIAEFQRTGFHGALNYYRAVQPYFDLCGAYRGAKITQPTYFMWGKSDGLYPIYQLTEAKLRDRLPGLAGYVGLDGVGHWVQHEAADQLSQQLVAFARSVSRPWLGEGRLDQISR